MERYPELPWDLFKGKTLPFEMVQKPDTGKPGARDVKTYLAADVDAVAARLAVPEPIDPRWVDVEAGRRLTMRTAMERYPELNRHSFLDKALPFEMVQKPKTGKGGLRDIKTYLPADVGALIARLAAPEPEPVDPRWLDVEAGRRYTRAMAMERYPELAWDLFKGKTLAFEIATEPKPGEAFSYVRTYLAADVDALAAERAKKRARPATQEPEPEPELTQEEPVPRPPS